MQGAGSEFSKHFNPARLCEVIKLKKFEDSNIYDDDDDELDELDELTVESELTPLNEIHETSNKFAVAAKTKKSVRLSIAREFCELSEAFISILIIIVLIFTFVIRITSVDGDSMLPTLRDRDFMLVTNFFYTPKCDDIVVIHADQLYNGITGSAGRAIIKRVIGVAGDEIMFDTANGVIYRNGVQLEIEIKDGLIYEEGYTISSLTVNSVDLPSMPFAVIVPEGRVLVLGDNRNNSVDSRFASEDNRRRLQFVGMVDVNYVIGRAFFRFAPLNSFGFVD